VGRNLSDIRRKIKGFKSTRQVTKAMELVSASKMRRAVQQAVALREYASLSWEILERIAAKMDSGELDAHPSLRERPVKKVLAILFTSDRGLCGSLHSHLFRANAAYLQKLKAIPTFEFIEYIAVGRKGQQHLARGKHNIIAAFPALSNRPTFQDVLPIKKLASDKFNDGTYDHVVILYTDFISALVQEPSIKVLLPFSPSTLKEMIATLMQGKKRAPSAFMNDDKREYTFEPSAGEVLSAILPQLTEVQVYQAVLEAAASEHSARMVAMRNATDNASEIIDDLTLTYNRSRQANITGELAELSASKAALD
jgi:F-type H+-transporting ATPase subunit gamma